MSLYPTKTRLALLRAVARGEVTLYWPGGDSYRDDVSPGRRCTSLMAELERAGWARRPTATSEVRPWSITDAGRAVLAAAESPDTHSGAQDDEPPACLRCRRRFDPDDKDPAGTARVAELERAVQR